MDVLAMLAAKFHEEAGLYKLLIVDSIIALFRVDYSGRGELSERQQKLNQMMSRLTKLSEEYNICVFITNQVRPSSPSREERAPFSPVLALIFLSPLPHADDLRSWSRHDLCP